MIVEWFLDLVDGLVTALAAAFDFVTPAVPSAVDGIPARVGTLAGYVGGTESWIPWSIAGPMIAVVGVAFGASFVIRFVRIAASFLTAGGGSAG